LIIDKILKNDWLLKNLKTLIYNNFEEDLLLSIFFGNNFNIGIDFYSILLNYMENKIELYLIKIFSKIQNDQMLMHLIDDQEVEYLELFGDYIYSIEFKNERVGKEEQDNNINILYYNNNIKFPNFLKYSKNLISFIHKKQKDFDSILKNENDGENEEEEEEEEEEKEIKEDNIEDDKEEYEDENSYEKNNNTSNKINDLIKEIEKYFESIIGINKKYIEKEDIQRFILEDFYKYFIFTNLNLGKKEKENLNYYLYILNYFVEQEVKFYCKECTGLQKIIKIFIFIERNPFIEIIWILFKTFEKAHLQNIFDQIENKIKISPSVLSILDGEIFAQIFDLLFNYLCENCNKEINNDNYDYFYYFIEYIEKIKNKIMFSTSKMMDFKNILLIYNITKKKEIIQNYINIGMKKKKKKKKLINQFQLIKSIINKDNNNEYVIEFLFNKVREDINNELTFEIFNIIVNEKDIELILNSKIVIDLILNKTILSNFGNNNEESSSCNIIIIKKLINALTKNNNKDIKKLDKFLNNNEKNIEESLRIVLLDCFDNIFHFYFSEELSRKISEPDIKELINYIDIFYEDNKYKKINNIILISYLRTFIEFYIKLKNTYKQDMWNEYSKDIIEKSKMEKTIKIYMNKIDNRIKGIDIDEYINKLKKNANNNNICNELFNEIIIFNEKKIDEYLRIIKKIGSLFNNDLNDITKCFDSFFDIFLNFYVNNDNENKFSKNIQIIYEQIIDLMELNEIQKKFYKNNFKDIIKNKSIINKNFSLYIIKIISLFLKENSFKKIKNKDNKLFKFIITSINYFTNRENVVLNELENEGHELIKNIEFKTYFLNIISNIENKSLSEFINDFENNSREYEFETSSTDIDESLNIYKIKIESIFIYDEIEPEQFEDIFINYKYFMYLDYPSLEGIKKIIDNFSNNTFIKFYIQNANKHLLNPLKINNFETKILDYYNNSHFISKQYSKQKIKEIKSDFEVFEDDFIEYKNYWNKLYANCQIEEELNLECILNTDNKNNKHGYQISKFYEEVIDTHNKYIGDFLSYIEEGKLSKYWKNFLSEEKLIQNVFLEYNVFNFDENKISSDKNKNFYEILYNNSKRDIIYKNNQFYFKNYNIIKYNFKKIENLLQKSLLVGKCFFKKEQIYIEYNQFDPLSNNIFISYNNRFEQTYLEEDTKKEINKCLKYKEENEKTEVLFYIKKLMKLINSNSGFYKKDNILASDIAKKQFEKFPKLLEDILKCEIRIKCIIDLYEFIELSIIYEKYYTKKKGNNDKFENIQLMKSTIAILRKFYLRFVYTNKVDEELLLNEVIFQNEDLFFLISNNIQKEKDNKEKIKIKEDMKKLDNFKVRNCLEIYLNKISEDKDLEKYSKIGSKKNKKKKVINN